MITKVIVYWGDDHVEEFKDDEVQVTELPSETKERSSFKIVGTIYWQKDQINTEATPVVPVPPPTVAPAVTLTTVDTNTQVQSSATPDATTLNSADLTNPAV